MANGGTAEQDAAATASGSTDKTEDDSTAGNEAPAASTSDASKQDAAVVPVAGEAKAQPAKAESQDVSATCSVVGTDAKGAQQTWAAAQQITLKEGSTAADLSEQLFKQAGLKADYDPNGTYGWALNTITSPFDKDRDSATTRRPARTGSCSSTAAPPRSARAATRSRTATPSSGATRSTATPRLSLRSLPRWRLLVKRLG